MAGRAWHIWGWCVLLLDGLGLLVTAHLQAADPSFRRHVINAESTFPAVAAIDVNQDGRLDIVCGGWWYEAPNWERRFLREVEQIRGRYDDYSHLPLDVNGDGRLDLISVNYRSQSLYWVENPGPTAVGPWAKHEIDRPGAMETGRLYDIDGDGRMDVLPNGAKFAAWWRMTTPSEAAPARWLREDLPEAVAGHGIGCGDLNADGRPDIVGPHGWLEATDRDGQRGWLWRPEFRLHRDASIPILVHDVDGDGDQDLIWGRGHRTGLYWLEQRSDESADRDSLSSLARSPRWRQHTIDASWSQAHSLLLADLDQDGRAELVAGKRYLGHDGKDIGEYAPLVIFAYRFDPELHAWRRSCLAPAGQAGFDLDPKAVDLDGDGDLDLLAAGRGGLWWLENLGPDHINSALDPAPPVSDAGLNPRRLLEYPTAEGPQPVQTPAQWALRREAILRAMQLAMGPLPDPSRRVPLDVHIVDSQSRDHYQQYTLTYAAAPGQRVTAYLLIPHDLQAPAPAALCLHPTAAIGKGVVMGYDKPNRQYAHELAEQGYVCLAPDYPSFGDQSNYDFDADHYVSGTMKAIWDNMRGLDLLESLEQVDPDRMVCIGHSLGGHNALFTAAFDQRIAAVVTSCGFTAFHHYYSGNLQGWTSDRYMPRIRTVYHNSPDEAPFDFYEVLASIALVEFS